jgi:syndecan 1
MRGAAGTSPSTFETAAAARLPVVQRSAADFLGPTTQPVTRPARAAGAGPAPGVPAYRIAPLLSAPRLAGPVMASRSAPDRVAPAVWRRPAAPTEGTVRPIAPQSGEPDHGVDIVAMAPARPARAAPPAVLPVTRVQRAQPTAGPSRTNSTSAPPVLSPAPTVSTAVQRPPETTRSPQDSPPRPDPLDGIEMDRLARMLFEPISRLLRADLRRGRERAGAGHDHRR